MKKRKVERRWKNSVFCWKGVDVARRVCQVGSIGLQVNWVVGRVGLGLPVFFKQVFYFILFYIYFQLQKQINDNLFKENE